MLYGKAAVPLFAFVCQSVPQSQRPSTCCKRKQLFLTLSLSASPSVTLPGTIHMWTGMLHFLTLLSLLVRPSLSQGPSTCWTEMLHFLTLPLSASPSRMVSDTIHMLEGIVTLPCLTVSETTHILHGKAAVPLFAFVCQSVPQSQRPSTCCKRKQLFLTLSLSASPSVTLPGTTHMLDGNVTLPHFA